MSDRESHRLPAHKRCSKDRLRSMKHAKLYCTCRSACCRSLMSLICYTLTEELSTKCNRPDDDKNIEKDQRYCPASALHPSRTLVSFCSLLISVLTELIRLIIFALTLVLSCDAPKDGSFCTDPQPTTCSQRSSHQCHRCKLAYFWRGSGLRKGLRLRSRGALRLCCFVSL